MDSRHPFSRQPPASRNLPEDPRYPPIPPPPYSSQRQDLPPHNDPFFPRRQQFDGHATSPTKIEQSTSFGLPPPPYPPNPFAATHGHSTNETRVRRGSYESNVLFDHLHREGNRSRNSDVPQQADVNRIQSVPPPPSQPQSSFPAPFAQGQYAQDPSRRSVPNGTNSSTMYGRALDHSSPPTAHFSHRQMLPPTSPQYAQAQYNNHTEGPRGPSSNIPFARDLPALSASHRPGSSMSISSMLGSASETKSREALASNRGNMYPAQNITSVPSPAGRTPHGSPPLPAISSGQHPKRTRTPDSHTAWRGDESRSRAFSGGPAQRAFARLSENPGDTPQTGPHGGPYPSQQPPYQMKQLGGTVQPDARNALMRRSSMDGLQHCAPRQPTEFSTPPSDHAADRERAPVSTENTRLSKASSSLQAQYGEPVGQGGATYGSQRDSTAQGLPYPPSNRSQNSSQPRVSNASRPDPPTGPSTSSYPFLSRSNHHVPQQDQQAQNHKTAVQAHDGLDFGVRARMEQSDPSTEKLRLVRESNYPAAAISQQSRQTLSHDLAEEQQMRSSPGLSMQIRRNRNMLTPDRGEHNAGNIEEGLQQPKNLLSLLADNNRRGGRVSPLPQAVQGAQGRMRGPASEPGIKNEFARMFSGIGSGVGSAMSTPVPPDSGASLSFPPSPTRVADVGRHTPLNGRRDIGNQVKPRVSAKGGRRSRKVKDEDSKLDVDVGDGAGLARAFSARGPKRVRQSYNLQNLHTNHHHHHVDGAANVIPFTVLNNAKRTFTPNQASTTISATTPHHHHHYSHHHHHHHHGAAMSSPVPVSVPRRPTITVDSKAVLRSVQDLPRQHLGSVLYAPVLSVPSWKSSHEQLRFGYVSTATPLPRFDGKENCTVTVRIPRYHLRREEREEICLRRGLWGSEIYSDDSDPVAVAIHGGWIRGAWGEDVDTSLLDLGPDEASPESSKDRKQIAETQTTLTSPPPVPMLPVKDRDLHMTVLILPTLQSYTGLVAHGIKSRSWTSKHDGLSFKVEKIAWVDEKAGRGEERGGEARRKRLRALLSTKPIDAGPAIPMNFAARELESMKTTAVAS